MVVDQSNIGRSTAFKMENNAPVGADFHRKRPLHVAFEGVLPEEVIGFSRGCGIESCKELFGPLDEVGPYPLRVASLIE